MLVLDKSNTYSFSNMVVRVTDKTAITDDTVTPTPDLPEFNILIPTVQDVGVTNVLEIYYPGEPNRYLKAHGKPNPLKYGFGPDFIHGILEKDAGVGIYTINLRGEDATAANVVVLMKYKVEEQVPYTDAKGAPYYKTADGQLTTSPSAGTPVVRDVLHLKFITESIEDCKKWTDLNKAMNNMYSEEADDEGYKTMPVFAIMYRGASAFGNNVYMSMKPNRAEYDGNVYYTLSMFDGVSEVTTDPIYSMDLTSGAKYNTSYFIETLFNDAFPNLRFMAAEGIEEVYDLISKYLMTLDEYLSGVTASSRLYSSIDMFGANEFQIQVDEGSLNIEAANAFRLQGGSDGTATRDELFAKFFNGEIIGDIASVLRYRVHYIPDIGYDDATKKAIIKLVQKRNRMTTARIMVGGTDTFTSALVDHQANYYDDMPNVSQLAKVQSPMMYNKFICRTITYPATYFDTMALMNHFKINGNFYQPFAGASARWTGFLEDTMAYPTETAEFINSLATSRVNFVMKDSSAGAYLADQQMNTLLESDQTELNNSFLISNMLYDLLNLVHRNHFKFNEAEEVRIFKEAVSESINKKYAPYSASLSVEVYRLGTVGRAKSANQITVTIDMKDINKFTDVNIILTDE